MRPAPGALPSDRGDGAVTSILDIAPTVLKYFGLIVPTTLEGGVPS